MWCKAVILMRQEAGVGLAEGKEIGYRVHSTPMVLRYREAVEERKVIYEGYQYYWF